MVWPKQRPVSGAQAGETPTRFCCIPGSIGMAVQSAAGPVQSAVANDGFLYPARLPRLSRSSNAELWAKANFPERLQYRLRTARIASP